MGNSTKDIAKQIRKDLKTLKGYVFSVRTENYSGGSSISIDVMFASKRMIRTIHEIPEINDPERTGRYNREQITQMQNSKHHQLNHYQVKDEYSPKAWNNGVFLTETGHNDLKKVVEIVEKYHKDSSDISTDYFNCNFYIHLNLGKWDVPFIDGV